MSISAEQKAHIVNLLKKKYPDWDGFQHQPFRRDEINYKRSTAKKAISLLSESTLAQLLVTRDTEGFIERLERIGQATALLQRNESEHGDLEILYVPTLDRPVFCAQIYHLLHGTESVNDRLAAYLQYVEDHELPNTWTFPTYLLQFCYPGSEFLVEPRPTEWYLKYMGLSPSLGKPTSETYVAIKQFARNLSQAMVEYRPQDMIDIQSAIHVCGAMTEPVMLNNFRDGFALDEEDPFLGDVHGFSAMQGGDGEARVEHTVPDAYLAGDEVEPANFWPETKDPDDSDPTMLFISEVSDESYAEVSDSRTSISTPVDPEEIRELRSKPFAELYTLFLTAHMTSPAGVARAAAFARSREAAEQNFAHLIAEHELGETVTDRVFTHLLPHADTRAHQHSGAWIHPVYASAEYLIATLNKKYSSDSQIRNQISQVLLEFIRHCVYKSNALEKSSEALARLDAISLINLSSITPILHALKPGHYVLLHEPTIKTINYFSGVTLASNLQALPELTAKALELIESLKKGEAATRFSSVHATDLFEMFATWLDEKKHFFHDLDSRTASPVDSTATQNTALPPPIRPLSAAGRDGHPPRIQDDPERTRLVNHMREAPSEKKPAAIDARLPRAQAYSIEQCARETLYRPEILSRWVSILKRKKNLLFYGPTGTGKTYMAQHLARTFVQNTDGIVHVLQLHPGYTYTHFMGPATETQDEGFFRQFCKEAAKRSGPCVLILDEINRIDVASVFGELLYMLEYRDIGFALSNPHPFDIPTNVYLVATMHPAGATKLMADPAVGRRFAFLQLEPDFDVLKSFHEATDFQVEGLVRTLTQLNEQISSPNRRIGITYFLRQDLSDQIEDVWQYEVEPQIEAAFSSDPEKIEAFRWSQVKRRLTR